MLAISCLFIMALITIVWAAVRAGVNLRKREFCWKREAQLILVYICIVVVVRFTFFPFDKVNGQVQPLLFYPHNWFPFRINWIPFVNLLDYPEKRDIIINVVGNSAMFLPLGIVWPLVFRELNTPAKAIAAGVGVSLCIEILQLPFYDRVTDVDDLILNSLGYLAGYGIYLLIRKCRQAFS